MLFKISVRYYCSLLMLCMKVVLIPKTVVQLKCSIYIFMNIRDIWVKNILFPQRDTQYVLADFSILLTGKLSKTRTTTQTC